AARRRGVAKEGGRAPVRQPRAAGGSPGDRGAGLPGALPAAQVARGSRPHHGPVRPSGAGAPRGRPACPGRPAGGGAPAPAPVAAGEPGGAADPARGSDRPRPVGPGRRPSAHARATEGGSPAAADIPRAGVARARAEPGPRARSAYRNRAVTDRLRVIVTRHVPEPEQAPLQLRNFPLLGVSVTTVPAGKLAPQAPVEHAIPAGELVTFPVPWIVTVSV